MTLGTLKKRMKYALDSHVQWEKKPIKYVGGETFHREWVKTYKSLLILLNCVTGRN